MTFILVVYVAKLYTVAFWGVKNEDICGIPITPIKISQLGAFIENAYLQV